MMQGLCQEDGAKIALVGELPKYGGGSPSHGILEIDGVAEVDGKGYAIDDDEYPLAYQLVGVVLLRMPGEEHHHDIWNIGNENGRSVEHQSASQHFNEM